MSPEELVVYLRTYATNEPEALVDADGLWTGFIDPDPGRAPGFNFDVRWIREPVRAGHVS